MIKGLDHIGIVVENLNSCLERYERTFHIKPTRIETLTEQKVRLANLPLGNAFLAVVQPMKKGEGVDGQYLEKHGEGLSHIAFRVNNLDNTLKALIKAGVIQDDTKPFTGLPGTRSIRLNPEDNNSVMIQLIERDEIYQNNNKPD